VPRTVWKRWRSILLVTDCTRVHTKTGYVDIHAVVRLDADADMKRQGVQSHLELTFQYEREGHDTANTSYNAPATREATAPTVPAAEIATRAKMAKQNSGDKATNVRYSIDLSRDSGPNEKLLWCHVLASSPTPSHLPAQSMEAESAAGDIDSEQWSDMEDGNDLDMNDQETAVVNTDNGVKKGMPSDTDRIDETSVGAAMEDATSLVVTDDPDRYYAGIDPDVLHQFLQWAHLPSMNELTAFFLLMTFPFYEHEWDMIGFVLDFVFGEEDDGDEDDDDR
jgi:hypothetical protein